MKRAIRQLIVLAAVLAAMPAAAAVAGPYDIIRDCVDDERLQGKYSDAQLQNALRKLTGDADEYSNCRSIISAAIGGDGTKAKGSKNDGGGRGGRIDPDFNRDGKVTAAERKKAKRLERERRDERDRERDALDALGDGIGDDDAEEGAGDTGGSNGIPLSAVLALAALVLGGAGGGTWFAAQRNPRVAELLRRVGLPLPPRD
ncbi:MAG: hypothetical protein WD993_03865 [Thermoleophilaceae bacterium]